MTGYIFTRNMVAMNEVMRMLGLEDKITIWFCHEVEINPYMSDKQLADLKEMALRNDEWDDEE